MEELGYCRHVGTCIDEFATVVESGDKNRHGSGEGQVWADVCSVWREEIDNKAID